MLNYYLLVLAAVPCFPFLILEGKRIRKSVPKLSEPTDIHGITGKFHQSLKLLTIGESTIAGVGVNSHREGFSGHLAASLAEHLQRKIKWEVFAKSGATAASTIQRLKDKEFGMKPDIVVVGLGGNDSFRFKNPSRWREDVEQLIEVLETKFPGCPIVFANMPPTSSFPAFSKLVKFFIGNITALMRREMLVIEQQHPNVYFSNEKIELKDWVNPDRPIEMLFSDGVHPSGLTYKLWASDLGKYIVGEKVLKG